MFFSKQKQAEQYAKDNLKDGADLFYHTIRSKYFLLSVKAGETAEDRESRLIAIADKSDDARFIKRIY